MSKKEFSNCGYQKMLRKELLDVPDITDDSSSMKSLPRVLSFQSPQNKTRGRSGGDIRVRKREGNNENKELWSWGPAMRSCRSDRSSSVVATGNGSPQKSLDPSFDVRVMDAPELPVHKQVCNCMDWGGGSDNNKLAITLGDSVYTRKNPEIPPDGSRSQEELAVEKLFSSKSDVSMTCVKWDIWGSPRIAFSDMNGNVRVWDCARKAPIRKMQTFGKNVFSIDHAGNEVIFGQNTLNRVQIMDVRSPSSQTTQQQRAFTVGECSSSIGQIRRSMDGTFLAVNDDRGSVYVYDRRALKKVHNGEETIIPFYVQENAHQKTFKAMEWSPHSTHCLATAGSADGRIRITDVCSGHVKEAFHRDKLGNPGNICDLKWSMSTNELVTVGDADDGFPLSIWSSSSMRKQPRAMDKRQYCYRPGVGRAFQICLSPQGRHAAIATSTEYVEIWKNLLPSRKEYASSFIRLSPTLR
jgi:WD40 repeat protein